MGSPVEIHRTREPARLFTPEEANALVPHLEATLRRTDPKLARFQEIRDLLDDLEAYWSGDIARAPADERARYARLLDELEAAKESLDEDVRALESLGVEVKDLRLGLADFYARRDGDLVYLCWQRGEPRVAYWHTLEGGFAGRRPLEPPPKGET